MLQLLQIAARNLIQHKRRALMLGGALAGVTALLVILVGLTAGIRETMIRSATTLTTGHVNVAGFFKPTAGQSAPVVTDYQKVMDLVREKVDGIDYMTTRGRGWGKVVGDEGSVQAGITGIDVANEPGFKTVLQLEEGSFDGLLQPRTVLIFHDQAERLGAHLGDTLTLSTTTTRGVANTMDVTVAAVARNAGLLSMWSVFIPTESLRSLYQLSDTTTGAIHVYLKDLDDIPKVTEQLRQVLGDAGYALMDPNPQAFWMKFDSVNREAWTGQKLDITTWEDEISFMLWTLQALQGLTGLLISVLMVIIVIGIMNTMWIAIRERTREIGTLRAIGMQRGGVTTLFLLEALLLGLAGTVVGAIVGGSIALGLNAAGIVLPTAVQVFLLSETLWFSIHAGSVLFAIAAISIVTTLAAVLPALRAARLRPVTAMHHIG